jgi:Na+/phosphate symporter
MSTGLKKIVPEKVRKGVARQFEPYKDPEEGSDPPSFDLIRASVNLTVASILIAFGTSMKLPLSTTYVTFMVAMGTSLSDKAWDRESAVYRISGVIAVIGGWFLTAMSAFTVAFIFVYIIYYGGQFALLALVLVASFIIYRTHIIHKRSKKEKEEDASEVQTVTDENIADKTNKGIIKNIKKISTELQRTFAGLEKEDIKELKKAKKEIEKMTARTKYLKDHINVVIDKLKQESVDTAYYFVTTLDYMREMLHSITYIVTPAASHVDNNHKPLGPFQIDELKMLEKKLSEMIAVVTKSIEDQDFSSQDKLLTMEEELLELIRKVNKNQIKRLKNAEVGTKSSILFLNMVNELKNLSLQLVNLYKSQRDFLNFKNGN